VNQAEWIVSVSYYHIGICLAESFMAHDHFGSVNRADFNHPSCSPSNPLYLFLAVCLTANATPYLDYCISRTSDGSAPLSPEDLRQLGISVQIQPTYIYRRLHELIPAELAAVLEHFKLDPRGIEIQNHLDECYGNPIHLLPEPVLPLYWERRLALGRDLKGKSIFLNTKTLEWSWSPPRASLSGLFPPK
jgi:hypothetical protein